jgi:soluble lytic murein transglycosylase-like protein
MNKVIILLTLIITHLTEMPVQQAQIPASALYVAHQRTGVPLDILTAVAYTESRFKCDAVGRYGEIGLMQINPKVWRFDYPDFLFDCYANALAGAEILKYYYNQTGSWAEAVERYNGNGKQAKRYAFKVLLTAQNVDIFRLYQTEGAVIPQN